MTTATASALALHGLGGGAYELRPVVEALEGAGLCVSTPALPGHDRPGPIMPRSHWRDWVDAAGRHLDDLPRPRAIVGFSTGATIALALAAARPDAVARLVLICPYLAVRHRWFYGLRPETYLTAPGLRRIEHVPRRPPAVRYRRAAALLARVRVEGSHYRSFNLHAARSALELIDLVRRDIADVTAPTLVLQARLDSVVDPAGASWLMEHLGSTEKRLVWLERSDHLAAWDAEADRAIAETRAFLAP